MKQEEDGNEDKGSDKTNDKAVGEVPSTRAKFCAERPRVCV